MLLSTDERLRPQIMSSLKWVAFSTDTLDADLLSEVFALHLEQTQDLGSAEALSTDGVLKYFCGLLLVNQDGGIQFDRPHIKEYLTSDRIRSQRMMPNYTLQSLAWNATYCNATLQTIQVFVQLCKVQMKNTRQDLRYMQPKTGACIWTPCLVRLGRPRFSKPQILLSMSAAGASTAC